MRKNIILIITFNILLIIHSQKIIIETVFGDKCKENHLPTQILSPNECYLDSYGGLNSFFKATCDRQSTIVNYCKDVNCNKNCTQERYFNNRCYNRGNFISLETKCSNILPDIGKDDFTFKIYNDRNCLTNGLLNYHKAGCVNLSSLSHIWFCNKSNGKVVQQIMNWKDCKNIFFINI
jgi:hypothetical protein